MAPEPHEEHNDGDDAITWKVFVWALGAAGVVFTALWFIATLAANQAQTDKTLTANKVDTDKTLAANRAETDKVIEGLNAALARIDGKLSVVSQNSDRIEAQRTRVDQHDRDIAEFNKKMYEMQGQLDRMDYNIQGIGSASGFKVRTK